jgi:hypothetical protein
MFDVYLNEKRDRLLVIGKHPVRAAAGLLGGDQAA